MGLHGSPNRSSMSVRFIDGNLVDSRLRKDSHGKEFLRHQTPWIPKLLGDGASGVEFVERLLVKADGRGDDPRSGFRHHRGDDG